MKLQSNIILTALLSAATLALTSCGGQKNREIPQAKFKTTKPAVKSTTFENKYSATIRGRQDVDVYPQVGGTPLRLPSRQRGRPKLLPNSTTTARRPCASRM